MTDMPAAGSVTAFAGERAGTAIRRLVASGLLQKAAIYAGLTVAAVVVAFPIYLAFLTSVLPPDQAASYPPTLFSFDLTLNGYREALNSTPLPRYVLNSAIVATVITAGHLITACLAAYAFAFLTFPGQRLLFLLFLATLMVPAEVTIVPNFLTIDALGWRNSYAGLTVPFLATAFGTFLLRQSFLRIPRELYDAARIDGCGHLRFLRRVVIPLARPALATLAAYSFLGAWNMFLWPLIATDKSEMRTVQVGISALQSQEALDHTMVMAGTVIALVPTLVLLLVAQRHLVRGLTAGAVKG